MPEQQNLERPERFTPSIVAIPGAAEEYVECGQRYWAWVGIHAAANSGPRTGTSVWAETTKEIAEELGEPAGRLYLIAAAGVEAVLTQIECTSCGLALALKSRTTLDDLIRDGGKSGRCARCDPRIRAEVAKLTDPTRAAARAETKRMAIERRAKRDAQLEQRGREEAAADQLQRDRRSAVIDSYPLSMSVPGEIDWMENRHRFKVELGTLAILDYSPTLTPIPSILAWDLPLGPSEVMTRESLVSGVHAGLLRIHPGSRLDGFVWSDEASAELTGGFYATRVDWYCGLGSSFGTAAEALQAWLLERTKAWLTTDQGVTDAASLAHELIVAETVRYLDDQLAVHHLPEVPENHRGRLIGATQRLAGSHSLGQCYSLAWRAARNAATMTRRHPGAPETSATAHAVNTFEQMVAEVALGPDITLPTYREDSRTPLSALTRTLSLRVLEVDIMATSVPAIEASLRSAERYPQPVATMLDHAAGQTVEDGPHVQGSEYESRSPDSPSLLAGYLAGAVARLDPDRAPDLDQLDQILIAGPDPILEVYSVREGGRNAIADGLDRLTALRASLGALADAEVIRTALALAYLMPGTLDCADGKELALGQVLGDELLLALGPPAEF